MGRRRILALIVGATLASTGALLSSCGHVAGEHPAAFSSATLLGERMGLVDDRLLRVTPLSVDSGGATFRITTTDEAGPLPRNLALRLRLVVAGVLWPVGRTVPSVHYGQWAMVVSFVRRGPVRGQVVLEIGGAERPLRLEWSVPGASAVSQPASGDLSASMV